MPTTISRRGWGFGLGLPGYLILFASATRVIDEVSVKDILTKGMVFA